MGIHAGRGNWTDAAISGAAAVPFLGMFATGGKFLKKAASKVDDVGGLVASKSDDLAEETARLTERANEFQAALDPLAQRKRTTAVLSTNESDIIGGGVRDLGPTQRALAKHDEVLAKLSGEHAEVTVLTEAAKLGLSPRQIVTTTNFCPACEVMLLQLGATITSPRSAVFR